MVADRLQKTGRGRGPERRSLYLRDAPVGEVERPEAGVLFLVSDNPDYAPELRAGAQMEQLQLAIIGKVVWWGHTAG